MWGQTPRGRWCWAQRAEMPGALPAAPRTLPLSTTHQQGKAAGKRGEGSPSRATWTGDRGQGTGDGGGGGSPWGSLGSVCGFVAAETQE